MKFLKKIFFLAVLLFGSLILPSCSSNKTGCPANEAATVKMNKKGNYPASKSKSGLFPKDMKKKMHVKG